MVPPPPGGATAPPPRALLRAKQALWRAASSRFMPCASPRAQRSPSTQFANWVSRIGYCLRGHVMWKPW